MVLKERFYIFLSKQKTKILDQNQNFINETYSHYVQCDDEIEKDLDSKLTEVKKLEWQLLSVFADRVCILCYTIVILVVTIWVYSFASTQDSNVEQLMDNVRNISRWKEEKAYIMHNGIPVDDYENFMVEKPEKFDYTTFKDDPLD